LGSINDSEGQFTSQQMNRVSACGRYTNRLAGKRNYFLPSRNYNPVDNLLTNSPRFSIWRDVWEKSKLIFVLLLTLVLRNETNMLTDSWEFDEWCAIDYDIGYKYFFFFFFKLGH
jgi:hypothetical protein